MKMKVFFIKCQTFLMKGPGSEEMLIHLHRRWWRFNTVCQIVYQREEQHEVVPVEKLDALVSCRTHEQVMALLRSS